MRLDRRDPVILLDVREDWETALCRLDNATHIPIEEIEFRTAELDPSDEIVVYCHHGVRSAAVAGFLRQQGFRAVNLEGGLDYLKDVVVNDKLGIGAELEAEMAHVVGTYQCEWKKAITDPASLRRFRTFVNADGADENVVFVQERNQIRPARADEKLARIAVRVES